MAISAGILPNPAVRIIGVSINSSNIALPDVDAIITQIERDTGWPCFDPLLHGAGKIVDTMIRQKADYLSAGPNNLAARR
jgi:uncharacterized NAD-dependent epimerase/dehydratase family protein